MTTAAIQELNRWLQARLANDRWQWLSERVEKIVAEGSARDFYLSFGMIPRKIGRDDLALTESELADARGARADWDPSAWSLDTAARALALCQLAQSNAAGFPEQFNDCCRSADLSESIALYSSLPLLPLSDELDAQVGEGLRTNVRAIFEAIAHRNPYPKERFDHNRWNHMVLKALFVDSALAPIQGIDERANEELARILHDYAHERWAAKRPVTPELWRCVGPFAEGELIEDLKRVVDTGTQVERNAALLALSQSSASDAKTILDNFPDATTAIANGDISWESIGSGDDAS